MYAKTDGITILLLALRYVAVKNRECSTWTASNSLNDFLSGGIVRLYPGLDPWIKHSREITKTVGRMRALLRLPDDRNLSVAIVLHVGHMPLRYESENWI